MPLSQQDREFLISKGIDPDTASYTEEEPQGMSGLHAATSTLKARAGSILGGGGGTIAGGAAGAELGLLGGPLAPVTVPVGALVGAVAGGLGGSYAGEKGQQAIVPADVEQRLQEEAAQAQEQHPWISRGTEIAASALASGGKFSPGALLRGGERVLAGDLANPVVRNLATQMAVNPAIDIGTSLAQGNGLPSGKDLLGDVVGGALFSEPSALGRLGHRPANVEPTAEPTANPTITPPVTDSLPPLKMVPEEPIVTEKNKDAVTQNKMEQTNVSENPIDKKAQTETTPPVQPPVKPIDPTELTQKIADPNSGPLTPEENTYLSNLSTTDPEAHKALLKAVQDARAAKTTTINAPKERQQYSDEDLQAYHDAQRRMTDTSDQTASPEFQKAWQDFEDVRNKYGGMPPKVEAPAPFKPSAGAGFTYQGSNILRELFPNPDSKSNTYQLSNALRNKLGEQSSEWKMWESLGIKGSGVNTPREMYKWMDEHGPKVEVKKFGDTSSPERKEFDNMTHNWFDSLQPAQKRDFYDFNAVDTNDLNKLSNWSSKDIERAIRYKELSMSPEITKGNSGSTAHWSSIAPKSERDMPGYTEIAVVKPYNKAKADGFDLDDPTEDSSGARTAGREAGIQFPSSHSFPPNTLGFVRGYMETRPDGGKTFHVIEVQSDWAQQERNRVQEANDETMPNRYRDTMRGLTGKEPLLPHYERLTLKAAIDHARSEGADSIAISDAETAMMTEGHDRYAHEVARRGIAGGTEFQPQTPKVPQEEGMRLHYDRTLPKIAKELTGSEGERVSFGEHRMARETLNEAGGFPDDRRIRKDLIFRDPDGSPKTDVTARVYPIDKVSTEPFTLTGKVHAPSLTETNIRNPIALAQHIQSGKATTGSVLQQYTQSPNHPMADLAQHFLNIATKTDLNTSWIHDPSLQRSQYEYGPHGDKVRISTRSLGDARVTMEEVAHSLTSKKISMFHGLEGAELKNKMDRYLNEGDNDAVKDLVRAYQKAAGHLGYSDILFKDTYNEADRPNKGAAGNPDIAYDIGEHMQKGKGNTLYAMGSLDEFIGHAIQQEGFQHLLNEMPSGVEGKSVWRQMLDAIKRLLGVDVKQGSMLEHVLDKSSDLISQERPTDTNGKEGVSRAPKTMDDEHYMGPIGRFTRAVIDRVHDIPRPDAKELANATKLSLNEEDHLRGRWKNSIIEAGQNLNGHDREMINRVRDIENTKGTLSRGMLDSDAQRQYYDVMKKNMSESGDYAIKANMPIASDKGPRPMKKDPAHWPSMENDEVRADYQSGDLARIAKRDKEFDNWNQKEAGLSPKGSAEIIKNYKEAIQGTVAHSDVSHQDQFKAFRRAMGTPIPPSFREPNPVKNDSRYFDRAAVALSHYKFIESNPRVMATLGATHDAWGKPIAPNPNGSLANNQQVKDLLGQFKGEPRGLGDTAEQSASSLLSNFLISGPTLEMHKVVSNTVKAASFSDNPYQLVRALGHAVTNINQGYRHAVEGGLVKLTATSTLDMFNGSLSSAQRLNAFGKVLRDISTLGGLTTKVNLGFMQSYFECLVPSKVSRANAGDVTAQQFVKRLDPTYTQGKTYTPEQTQQLASTAGLYVHGTGDIRSMPAWIMNDSEVSGFFKLAHWSVAQTNNFMHDVWTPARQGNLTPLITSVFGATIGGYVIKQLREEMSGKKSGIPSLTEIANSDRGLSGNAGPLMYNAIAAMQYSGFGGLLSQVAKYPFDFVYKNIPQGATFPLDQIATDLAKTVGQVTSAIANDPSLNWVDLAKAVTGHVLQNDMQLSRIAINQGIDHGLITGLPAEKKMLADKMGQLRRFDMVEGLPYNDIDQTSNPYMNIEQQKFKYEPDVQQAVRMIPELVTNIMSRYHDNPDVMMSKLKALKENQYETMPSLESMPMQFFRYMQYVQRTKGEEAAQDMMRDYMTHRIVNQVKSSVAP